MDVDNDIDGQLLQQLRTLGTQDREVLVKEFQRLLGNQLNPSACSFFLDMNNWNLTAAIGSYYDYELNAENGPQLSMVFVKDITIGEGESVRPNVNFIKTWKIKNSGNSSWPPGCSLKFTSGCQLGAAERVMIESLDPGAELDVSVPMTSPSVAGMYQGQWRMSSPTGVLFGDTIWVILQVSETGLLDITQEMYRFGGDLGNSQAKSTEHLDETYNPFSSPPRHSISNSQQESNRHLYVNGLSYAQANNGQQTISTQHDSQPNDASSWHISFQSKAEGEDMQ